MMGNKDYLSGGCDMGWCAELPGKLCYEKLDKKSENDYMIMPENINKNLEQNLQRIISYILLTRT